MWNESHFDRMRGCLPRESGGAPDRPDAHRHMLRLWSPRTFAATGQSSQDRDSEREASRAWRCRFPIRHGPAQGTVGGPVPALTRESWAGPTEGRGQDFGPDGGTAALAVLGPDKGSGLGPPGARESP